MAGERSVHGGLGRFFVADFANQDDVRVLTENGAKAGGKGVALLRFHLGL